MVGIQEALRNDLRFDIAHSGDIQADLSSGGKAAKA
jgi:hypothetical protein